MADYVNGLVGMAVLWSSWLTYAEVVSYLLLEPDHGVADCRAPGDAWASDGPQMVELCSGVGGCGASIPISSVGLLLGKPDFWCTWLWVLKFPKVVAGPL